MPLLALSPIYINWTGGSSNETSEYLNVFRLVILFTCQGVGLQLLALICYDRYETLVKYNQQRILTHARAKCIVALVWVECFSFTTSKFLTEQVARPKIVATPFNSTVSTDESGIIEQASGFALIGIVALWITVSSTVIFRSLYRVGLQIKHHLESVRSTLGHMRSLEEIDMVKVAVMFFVTYTLLWLTYGFARSLYLSKPSKKVSCFFEVTSLLVYMTFSIIPVLYILTDKRIRARVKMKFFACMSSITNDRVSRVNPR